MNKDLTVGEPEKVLWKFCLPLFGGIIFQQLYNIADSFVAGKFIGENALAAVGASTSITMLFVMLAVGTGIGSSVVISLLFGAKQMEKMKTAIYTAIITVLVFSIFLSIVGVIINKSILRLMGTPDAVFEDAAVYLGIYFYGFVFLFLYNVFIHFDYAFPTDPNNSIFSFTVALIASAPGARSLRGSNPLPS